MPIYEYRRPDGSTFEVLQSFTDEPLTHDPNTGAPVERVLHAPAVHFKGKGFYNTDYGTRKRQRETSTAGDSNGSGATSEGVSSNGSSGAAEQSSSSDGASTASESPKKTGAKPEKTTASSPS
jgi:putative FmdB family regulatory protein